jgi:hypothetical protein
MINEPIKLILKKIISDAVKHVSIWALVFCGQLRSPTNYSPPSVSFADFAIIVVAASLLSLIVIRVTSPLLNIEVQYSAKKIKIFYLIYSLAIFILVPACVVQFREMLGYGLGRSIPIWPFAIICFFAMTMAVFGTHKTKQALMRSLITLGAITFGVAVIARLIILAQSSSLADQPQQRDVQVKSRLIFLVFDEMDGALTLPKHYEDRSGWMPQISNLLKNAVSYSNASSTADNTFESIPAILTGSNLKSIDQINKRAIWRDSKGIGFNGFDETMRHGILNSDPMLAGRKIGYIGWYHPYCGYIAIGPDCAQLDMVANTLESFNYMFNNMIWCRKLYICLPSSDRATHSARAIKAIEYIDKMISTHSILFIHMPVPHAPCSRVWREGEVIRVGRERDQCNYSDSITLADIVVGELLKSAHRNCPDCALTIALTSDHPYRVWLQPDDQKDKLLNELSSAFTPALADDLAKSGEKLRVPMLFYNENFSEKSCDSPHVSTTQFLRMGVAAEKAAMEGRNLPCTFVESFLIN